jgi:hypothetical protein
VECGGESKAVGPYMALSEKELAECTKTMFNYIRQSQRPRDLRRRSTAARLPILWVRIPPGAWMFIVRLVCCQVEVSASG